MLRASFLPNLNRSPWLPTLAGLVCFAASFAALVVFAHGAAAALLPTSSDATMTAILAVPAALIGQCAASVTASLLIRRLQWKSERMRTALDSMTQGLSMFDANERLVV